MFQHRALSTASAIWLLLLAQLPQGDPGSSPKQEAALPGPAVGDPAPGFELSSANDPELRLPLAAWLDGRPLALVLGSSTSAQLGAAARELCELALVYGEQVTFLFVYLREAPAPAGPDSLAERRARCAAAVTAFGFPFPAVIDELDDRVGQAYAAHPERLFLIRADGHVAFAGGRGVDPSALELAILEQLTGSAPAGPPGAPERRHAEAGLLAALDIDGDGTLSSVEIDGASAVLRGFDLDGDGTLVPGELRRAIDPGRASSSAPAPSSAEPAASTESTGAPAVRPVPEAPSRRPEPTDPPERGPAGERSIESFDYDHDGRLSRIEVPRALLERWETFDLDDDGYLDATEQAALREPGGG
jgi:hypothetical protein